MQLTSQQTEYVEAFRSVRLAKGLTSLAVLLAIAAQGFTFAAVRFGGVIDAAPQVTAPMTTTASMTATAPYDLNAVDQAKIWYDVLNWGAAASKFLAVVAAMLLGLTLLVGVKLTLLGRLGGVASLISAMFWSLILFAVLIPWQQVLDARFASGALFNLSYVVQHTQGIRLEWGDVKTEWLDLGLYYARFIAYPAVALLVWLVVQIKFAKGYKKVRSAGAIPAAPPQAPVKV